MLSSLESLQPLEEKFKRIEEELEQRARLEEEREALEEAGGRSSVVGTRQRRAGSISVTRFGEPPEQTDGSASPDGTATTPLASAARRSQYYHTLAHPKSFDSLVSTASNSSNDARHFEDTHQTTQVERIAPRPSISFSPLPSFSLSRGKGVSSLLPKRLSRAASSGVLGSPLGADFGCVAAGGSGAGGGGLVIGVCIEEKTGDAHAEEHGIALAPGMQGVASAAYAGDGSTMPPGSRSSSRADVHSHGGHHHAMGSISRAGGNKLVSKRPRAATVGVPMLHPDQQPGEGGNGWMDRAKEAMKLRRKKSE